MRALIIAGAAFAGALSFVAAASAETITAQTETAVQASGPLEINDVKWSCLGNFCTMEGPAEPSTETCAALAAKVGPITYYGQKDKNLAKKGLKTCNETGAAWAAAAAAAPPPAPAAEVTPAAAPAEAPAPEAATPEAAEPAAAPAAEAAPADATTEPAAPAAQPAGIIG